MAPPGERPSILVSRGPVTATPTSAPSGPAPGASTTPAPPKPPTASPPDGAPPQTPNAATALQGAFSTTITFPPLSVAYRFFLLLLAAAVLLLPLIYLLLPLCLAGLGLAWAWWLKDHVRGVRSLIGTVVPPLGLGLAALTVLAPVFRRKQAEYTPAYVLSRADEPLVHAWVEQTAKAVGAPLPDQVELLWEANACVVFHKDYRILRLGLPLLAVCTLTEATGILAHELGHLKQGWARRGLLLCMGVERWFGEVLQATRDVLERNPEGLEMVAGFALWSVSFVVRFFRFLARRICLGMARQMELDADRYEVSVSGPASFVAATDKLAAAQATIDEILDRARFGQDPFPDDLARYTRRLVAQLPPGVRKRIARDLMVDAAGVPHPPYDARIKAARSLGVPGAVQLHHLPAAAVFNSFEVHSRAVTARLVRAALPGCPVVPADQVPAPPP